VPVIRLERVGEQTACPVGPEFGAQVIDGDEEDVGPLGGGLGCWANYRGQKAGKKGEDFFHKAGIMDDDACGWP
jgi:hypothetical protein